MAQRPVLPNRAFLLSAVAAAAILTPAATATASAPERATSAPDESAERILTAAATSFELDRGDLRVAARATTTLPLTGRSLVQAKVLDVSTGQAYGVALDAAGRPVDLAALRAAEARAHRQAYSTMTPELAEIVAAAPPGRRVPVAFWLRSDHAAAVTRAGMDRGVRAAEVVAAESATIHRVAASVSQVTRPFAADLRSTGHRVVLAAALSPAVFAQVPAAEVAALAADPRVQQVSFAGHRARNAQDVVRVTTAARKVHARGITGVPALLPGLPNVGVVECCDSLFEEDGNDLDAENNYWLARLQEGRSEVCPGDHSHPTAIAGIIASTHARVPGIAPNSRLYLNSAAGCGGAEPDLVAAAQDVTAKVNGAVNHSYRFFTGGEPCPGVTVAGTLARTLDDLVRLGGDAQFVAAANDGNGSCVGAPATAWNVTSVGAFDDRGTVTWADDAMIGFSNGGDPASDDGDRTKPEVAGPGVDFTGLLPSAGGGPTGPIGSGTSYAAPVYVGAAALAEERRPFLAAWPETEKAVLLASSCHNIEGDEANSSLDGAGGPDLAEMLTLLDASRFRGDTVPNGSGVAVAQSFYAAAGQQVRVALAWDTNSAYSGYATDPADDLDLVVRRPDGTVAAESASFDNNHEVIEFAADQSGTYEIEVHRYRTDDPAGFTFAGLAWHRYAPAACAGP